ncbi:WAT1-related protein [Melia azedarach]|uniref:WAT1-related protein n=1 Tax=Melia azedarach TaxID=155640 RepID=A0ACC1XVX5_MELAZ|nr:WAT1-related protein [Melia azedarach]
MANKFYNFLHGIKPVIAMVLVQAVVSGVNIFYKLAVYDGMNMRVLIAYRYIFATAFVVPLALIFERGSLAQNLSIEGLALTSATFVTSLANIIPALTFILAIIFRMEKWSNMRKMSGIGKVMGTLLGIGGAMVLIFYKGIEINIWSTDINLLSQKSNPIATSHRVLGNHLLGSLFGVACCFSYAIWYILQAKMGEKYPCKYSSTALMCITAAVQATVYAICVERDWSSWKLGWNIRLLSVVYTGTLASGLMVAVMAWYLRTMGPLYVSNFSPLALVFVALFGSLFLDEKLNLGSIIGSVLIIIGLYGVIWGKGKEMKNNLSETAALSISSSNHSQTVEVVIDDHQTTTVTRVYPIEDQIADEYLQKF